MQEDNMIAEKTVKEEYQESQESQPEQEQNNEKTTPPTKTEWYIRDVLSTIDRLRGALSQEELWRCQAVSMCVERISRDAEKLKQYVLDTIETQNNFEGGTDMSEITKPEGMYRMRRTEASEMENLTDQEPAKEESEAPEDQHVYMELPNGERCCVLMSADVREFVNRIDNMYTAILYLEECIAMTTENMVNIADYLKGIRRANEKLLEYLDK